MASGYSRFRSNAAGNREAPQDGADRGGCTVGKPMRGGRGQVGGRGKSFASWRG